MNQMKTTDEARAYFKESNINYFKITRTDIDKLIELIPIELKNHKDYPMRLSKIVRFKENSGDFISCYLFVNGDNFNKRQAISFENSEWIGFSGWASSNNSQPFINAFIKWCDFLKKINTPRPGMK